MKRFYIPCLLAVLALLSLTGCGNRNPAALIERGQARLESGRYAAAARAYKKASRSITNSLPLYYNLGMACYNLGNFEAALNAFSAARTLDPTHLRVAEMVARSQAQQGMTQQAIILLQPLTRGVPLADRPRLLNALADAELANGASDLALLHLQRASRIDPEHAATRYSLGEVLAESYQLHAEAIEQFEAFMRLAPDNDQRKRGLRDRLLRLRAAAPAASELQQQNVAPQSSAVAVNAIREGDAHYQAKRWLAAEEAYARATTADPLSATAAIRLGHAMMGSGKFAEAAKVYQRASEVAVNNVEPAYMQSMAAYQAGNFDNAATILTSLVIPRWPAHAASFQLMAYIRANQQRYREAVLYGEHYLDLMPATGQSTKAFVQWLDQLSSN